MLNAKPKACSSMSSSNVINYIYLNVTLLQYTWMSLRQVSRCSIVSTRTMSLQSAITSFSPHKPSPFSCRASSSSSNCRTTSTNLDTSKKSFFYLDQTVTTSKAHFQFQAMYREDVSPFCLLT